MTSRLDPLLDNLSGLADPVLAGVPATNRADLGGFLSAMASIGIAEIASEDGWNEAVSSNQFFRDCTNALMGVAAPEVDWADVVTAQNLFTDRTPEIGAALLLAALPQTYATERGSKVLMGTGGLTVDPARRIRGTAQFLMLIMLATKASSGVSSYESSAGFAGTDIDGEKVRNAWRPGSGVRWRVCATLRVHHETIRRLSSASFSFVPLNQEDLLGALLTFSITTFEVLEQFGISWTAEQQLAYLRTWNLIGFHLGVIGLPDSLPATPFASLLARGLPQTVADANQVLAEIRSRNWKPLDQYTTLREQMVETDAGVQLISVLLAELTSALQSSLQSLPEIVIRQLAQPVVQNRLGLGSVGLLSTVLESVSTRRSGSDRPTVTPANRLRAAWLRQAANAVTRAATVSFVRSSAPPGIRPVGPEGALGEAETPAQTPQFVIPGLVEWLDPVRARTPSRYAATTSGPFNLGAALQAAMVPPPAEGAGP